MWVEAILTKDDLARLVGELLPLSIRLGEGGSLTLTDPTDVSLLAERGLRVTCKAELHWPVWKIDVPIKLHSLALVVTPTIDRQPDTTSESLVFKLTVEHADFAMVPAVIDDELTGRINDALAARHLQLGWNFTRTLSHVFPLPALLQSVDALALRVAWGRVKVTPEALVLAVSFHTDVGRRSSAELLPPAAPRQPELAIRRAGHPVAVTVPAPWMVGASIAAVSAGVGYAVGRLRQPPAVRSRRSR